MLIKTKVKVENTRAWIKPTKISKPKNGRLASSGTKKAITANQIIKTVSQFYDIQEKFLFEKTRRKEVVKPRQIAMYLLRQDFSGSYPYIGQKFGGRDHTTVIHAYEKISNDLKNNERLKEEIKNIRDLINKSA